MNWLAHAWLSQPGDTEAQLGNLLADVVKGRERAAMSPGFLRGAQRHQAIDAFTDSHHVVHRSWGRIAEEHRRFAGVLTDVFYDHFLAIHWTKHAAPPLDEFTADLYGRAVRCPIALPTIARAVLERMIEGDWLGSYARLEGIEATLRRISRRLTARLGRPFALERAMTELEAHFDGLAADFEEFFPALQCRFGPDSTPAVDSQS